MRPPAGLRIVSRALTLLLLPLLRRMLKRPLDRRPWAWFMCSRRRSPKPRSLSAACNRSIASR